MEKSDNLQNRDSFQSSQKKQKETILSWIWRKTHKTEPPYYYYYSIWTIIIKPIRKYFSAVIIPTIPFSDLRVACYRLCGYKIGKNVFIGMRCYLDDTQYKCIKIGGRVMVNKFDYNNTGLTRKLRKPDLFSFLFKEALNTESGGFRHYPRLISSACFSSAM